MGRCKKTTLFLFLCPFSRLLFPSLLCPSFFPIWPKCKSITSMKSLDFSCSCEHPFHSIIPILKYIPFSFRSENIICWFLGGYLARLCLIEKWIKDLTKDFVKKVEEYPFFNVIVWKGIRYVLFFPNPLHSYKITTRIQIRENNLEEGGLIFGRMNSYFVSIQSIWTLALLIFGVS